MKPGVKITLGIFTAATVIGFIPTYDYFIKDKIDSVEVVVVKPGEQIEKNEVLSDNKLMIERRRKQDLVGGVVYADDMNTVIGKEASQVIVGNAMLSSEMVDFDELVPNEEQGEAIRPIPADWIYAIPGSLRRKDGIDIYLVSKEYYMDSTISSGSNTVSSSSSQPNVSDLKEPILKNVKVVYAKDSSNREVTNDQETNKDSAERLNATGIITDLEILLNEEDFQKLMKEVVENEKKLYITYN